MNKLKTWFFDWWSALAAVVVGAIAVSTYSFYFSGGVSNEHDRWGQFGDYVGGIANPLVALFALIMLIRTLKVQKEELAATRDVMQRQLLSSQFFDVFPLFVKAVEVGRREKTAAYLLETRIRNDAIPLVGKYLDEVEELTRKDPILYKPIVSLLKSAAFVLHTHDNDMSAGEIHTFASMLRGFIAEFEASLILKALRDDPSDEFLRLAVDKYQLCAGVSEHFKRALWSANDRAESLINGMPENFRPQDAAQA